MASAEQVFHAVEVHLGEILRRAPADDGTLSVDERGHLPDDDGPVFSPIISLDGVRVAEVEPAVRPEGVPREAGVVELVRVVRIELVPFLTDDAVPLEDGGETPRR